MKLLVIFVLSALLSNATAMRVGMIQEEMRWHGWAPGGQLVEINNVHGNVRAEPASGDEIEVIAIKHGTDDPELVAIEVVEHKGGVTICAVYPTANPGHPFECRPSHGGGFRTALQSETETHLRWENGGGGDVIMNDLRVDFVVRIPKRLRFLGRTYDGEVSAHLLNQDLEAHSVLGDVRVDLDPTPGANVRAESSQGRVQSVFPLNVRSKEQGHGMQATGHIGSVGHRMVRLRTDTGTIHLDRASSVL